MEYTDFVGIDVSQGTLDVVVRSTRIHEQIANTVVGRNKLLKWLERQGVAWEGALFCFENTGIYSLPLLAFLADRKVKYAQSPVLQPNGPWASNAAKRTRSTRQRWPVRLSAS